MHVMRTLFELLMSNNELARTIKSVCRQGSYEDQLEAVEKLLNEHQTSFNSVGLCVSGRTVGRCVGDRPQARWPCVVPGGRGLLSARPIAANVSAAWRGAGLLPTKPQTKYKF